MTNPTMIVNASRPLPLDWEPDDLVDLWISEPLVDVDPNALDEK